MELTQKAYASLRTIIRGVFKYAKRKRYTELSISTFFQDLDLSKRMFRRNKVDPLYQEYTMEYFKEAISLSMDIALNSLIVWVTYIPLFIIAVFARKKAEAGKRIAPNVMLGASVPGMLIVLYAIYLCASLFFKAYIVLKKNQSTAYYSFDDLFDMIRNYEGIGITLSVFTFIIAGIECLIFIICGAVIIKSGTSKIIGLISIIVPIILIIGGALYVGPFCYAISY